MHRRGMVAILCRRNQFSYVAHAACDHCHEVIWQVKVCAELLNDCYDCGTIYGLPDGRVVL